MDFPSMGDKVRYHPIIGQPHDGKIYECASDMWALGDGTAVIKLKGKAGAVSVLALSPVERCL